MNEKDTVEESSKIKICIIHQKQKNGDVYVIERKQRYDKNRKYSVSLGSKIIGKIPKGETEMVSTRPKRPNGFMKKLDIVHPENITAARTRSGMIDIVDYLGKDSGVEQDLYESCDKGTADKILSLAWYLLCTNGSPLPGIRIWQLNHRIPYSDGISEDMYSDLFKYVGVNEQLMQSFFYKRAARFSGNLVLAYDSTTVSSYSEKMKDFRPGFNKDHDGLDTIKILALYNQESRQPVAFAKQPGNLPDITAVLNALHQLDFLNLNRARIITDNGFFSWNNLTLMFQQNFHFLSLVDSNQKIIRKVIDSREAEFSYETNRFPDDFNTFCVVEQVQKEFIVPQKNIPGSDSPKDEKIKFNKNIYIHVYFSPERKIEEEKKLAEHLALVRQMLLDGYSMENFSGTHLRIAKKFLIISDESGTKKITYNEEAIATEKKYYGYFSLVSDYESDSFEGLRTYRKRNRIESFFEKGKQYTDGKRPRVWSDQAFLGRLFIQFVTLCLYEHLYNKIRHMIQTLGQETGDPTHDKKGILDAENKLKSWLSNESLHFILQWFDSIETTEASSTIKKKRWSTEITKRDQLFLTKLTTSLDK